MSPDAPKYTDFVDYILGITEEIWEGRGIDLLHDYYSTDILVRSPEAIVEGNAAVINATRATLAQFPDRHLLGEDVIWAHTGDDSWYSSHRILTTATHAGSGSYGPATGRKVVYRVIGDCHAEECPKSGWRINDEWLVRDQGAIVRQLGFSPREFAQKSLAAGVMGDQPRNCILREDYERPGPYRERGNSGEPGQLYADILERIMRADIAVIHREYDRGCQLDLPGGNTVHGREEADRFWVNLRASFPDAEFCVDNIIGRSDEFMPMRAAARWTLHGKHAGHGAFGEPSFNDVFVMGLSHAEFGPRGLKREFVLFDETAVWMQILQ